MLDREDIWGSPRVLTLFKGAISAMVGALMDSTDMGEDGRDGHREL